MKNLKYFALSSMLALPALVSAAPNVTPGTVGSNNLSTFLTSVLTFINQVLIPFILGIAFLIFVWGMFQFFIVGGANDEAKEKGKSLLVWSILGFVLILVFWGIINLVVGATGLQGQEFDTSLIPTTPVAIPPPTN